MTHKAIPLSPVDSSQIHAIGHDPSTNTLAIQFKSKGGPGSVYHYQNVTPDDFAKFQSSESKGKHFSAHIKPHTAKHPYVKVS